jgi:hypothetical protein
VTPLRFLILSLIVTLAAACAQVLSRWRVRRRLQQLAASREMHYCADDRFHFANAVAAKFPVPGAADLRVRDLIYGNIDAEPDATAAARRYVFTAEFTIGVVRTKKRRKRVVAFREPKDRMRGDDFGRLELAPEELPLLDQYRLLAGMDSERAGLNFPSPQPSPVLPGEGEVPVP